MHVSVGHYVLVILNVEVFRTIGSEKTVPLRNATATVMIAPSTSRPLFISRISISKHTLHVIPSQAVATTTITIWAGLNKDQRDSFLCFTHH